MKKLLKNRKFWDYTIVLSRIIYRTEERCDDQEAIELH
jgi:hypothetical protein